METAVLLCAGTSSRFEPLNSLGHKGLVSLLGKTFAQRTIEMLMEEGFRHIVSIINPNDADQWAQIQEVLRTQHHLEITCIPQSTALGMANAIMLAKEHLGEDFLVISPYHYELTQTVKMLKKARGTTLALTPTDHPERYGIATFDPASHRLLSLIEKPTHVAGDQAYKVVSVYRFSVDFLQQLATYSEHYALEQALHDYAQTHPVSCVISPGESLSLKYSWQVLDHLQLLLSQQQSAHQPVGPFVHLDDATGAIVMETGCTVGQFTILRGPLYLGKDVIIGDHCLIRDSALEQGSVVGAYSEVARSLIMEQSKLHNSYVADSLIGPRCQIGADLLTTNKRLDRAKIQVKIKGEKIDSGRTALGVLMGPDVVTGSRVTTMPGTIVPANSIIMPNQVLPVHQA